MANKMTYKTMMKKEEEGTLDIHAYSKDSDGTRIIDATVYPNSGLGRGTRKHIIVTGWVESEEYAD
jgi:hypothetical protein